MDSKLLNYFNGDELAASVWQGKYAQEGEETPDDMHRRMAKKFAQVELKYGSIETPLSEELRSKLSSYAKVRKYLTEDRIYEFFKDFKYIIPQGSVMSQLGSNSIGSLSNCFVVGQPIDSYGGIFHKDQQLAQLMKRRGGVGIDISTLRPEGVGTSNAAKSSTGAVSFMHRYSNTTREVAQKGRRGALMISIDINHPDVMEFIKIKRDLTQVTGANISIKLNDEFMKAVENDEDYELKFPCDLNFLDYMPKEIYEESKKDGDYNILYPFKIQDETIGYTKKIKAKEYWDEIIKSAHNVAEPGLMFWDNMVEYSPDGIYPQFRQITTNPCSEIGMQPYDACRLIAMNLFSFVINPFTSEAEFDFDKFYKYNYEAMRLSDDLIDLEVEHINRIIEKIHKDITEEIEKGKLTELEVMSIYKPELDLWTKVKDTALASRRTGLGITGLGDTLAALGLKYDSDEALCMIENIMDTKMVSELDCTIDLAILRGTFEGWDKSKEFILDNDYKGAFAGKNEFYQFLWQKFPVQTARMLEFGRRNVSWSTIAPTGSLSIMAKIFEFSNISSGLEPLFMAFYMRRKKVNPGEEGVRVDFTDQNGDTWQEYPVIMGGFKAWIYQTQGWDNEEEGMVAFEQYLSTVSKHELQKLFEMSPWYQATAPDIDWVRRVEIQGVIQKYITHSISSTINLPSDVTEEEVSEIYLESWKKGLKGITVYRDGSRSGVLVSDTTNTNNNTFNQHDAPKRPEFLPCRVHSSTSKGSDYLVIVGLMDDKPYEVFIVNNEFNIPNKIFEGTLIKVKRGNYRLIIPEHFDFEAINSEMSPEQEAVTRLVSTSLRHGADIKFIVEQLGKTGGDMFSFVKSLARVLKKYIPDGEKSTLTCDDCGSENVVFQEGCHSCQDCGSSKCG